MRIKRIFNNNVILAYQNDSEVVIFGKGVGFQKKHGDNVEMSKIEKVFVTDEKQTSHFESLFAEISTEYANLTYKIVKQAESDLQIEFNSSIYIAVMDHINYVLTRAKEGVFVKNPLIWEIKRTYVKEYQAALKTLEIIKKDTGIELPVDEAGTIAIHYFNAQDPRIQIQSSYKAVEIIQNIIKIIQFQFRIEFSENDMNYNRLMTHLRYFVNGLLNGDIRDSGLENEFIFKQMRRQYTEIYDCVLKIREYLYEKLGKTISDEELTYLMIHIQRIVEKEKNKAIKRRIV